MRKITLFLITCMACLVVAAATFQILSALSPFNSRRPHLSSQHYIILHTTEGAAAGSLAKLRKNGEAHFLVTRKGLIYRLIDDNRLAKHAGRSMWNGRNNVSEFAFGIENEGYHNKPLTPIQEKALAYLLAQLKARYNIPDVNILTHSMVAYGAPNRWFARAQRGRKRCGMLMADPAVRARLGIGPGPKSDPDVAAGRLIVGDKYLFSALFDQSHRAQDISRVAYEGSDSHTIGEGRTAWFISRDRYDDASTIYTLPSGRVVRGNEVRNWRSLPNGTKVTYQVAPRAVAPRVADRSDESDMDDAAAKAQNGDDSDSDSLELKMKKIGIDGDTAYEIAGSDYARVTTIYFLPDGRVRTGAQMYDEYREILQHLPTGTGVLVGYVYGGYVTAERSALAIAGDKWNSPATYYRIPVDLSRNKVALLSGDDIDDNKIPIGTLIFYAQ
jgi:N-acetylmuramoyl-L-alanine amidase